MSRKKLLFRGVVFSYGAIAVQIFYSFASIPLALSFLSKEEFGLWGLITTISGYLGLVELGLTNAITRHLLECKGENAGEKYGRLFGGSALVLGLVAVAVFVLGLGLAKFAWKLFPIPADLVPKSIHLMVGQAVVTALGIATNVLGAPLYVNHRQDLGQIRGIAQFLIMYAVLIFGFRAGWGVYSMLANQAACFLWTLAFNAFACKRLGFYPTRRQLGLPLPEEWGSIWKYSKGVFGIQVGSLVLSSLPQLMIVWLLGLEAGAIWLVCTRPFAIVRQVVGRPFDVALPMLYDSFIAGKMESVCLRWSQLSQGTLAVSGVLFSVAAANNANFIGIWTSGRIHWDDLNHWLVAAHFFIITAAGLASGGLGMSKNFGRSHYIAFAQILATIVIGILAAKSLGAAGLILALTIPYGPGLIYFGVRYLASITGQPFSPLLCRGVLRPASATPLCFVLAWSLTPLSGLLPAYLGLLLSASLGALAATLAMLSVGVSPQLRGQAFAWARKTLRWQSATRAGT